MNISDGERLIAIMLADIMRAQGINGEIDPDFVVATLTGKDSWALKVKYGGLFHDTAPRDEADVQETYDILDMFRSIRHATDALTPDEQAEIKALPWYEYRGFDGNNDEHYGIASTLLNQLGYYDDFTHLNSHSRATLPRYQTMLAKWREYSGDHVNPLTVDHLRDLCSN